MRFARHHLRGTDDAQVRHGDRQPISHPDMSRARALAELLAKHDAEGQIESTPFWRRLLGPLALLTRAEAK